MVINSRQKTQILTVGPSQRVPCDAIMYRPDTPGTGALQSSVHCSAQVRPGPGPVCTDYWPASPVSGSQGLATTTHSQQLRSVNLLRTFVRKLRFGQVTGDPGAPRAQLSGGGRPPHQ